MGHVSHLVMLLSIVLVTKPSKNGSHLTLEQMSLFFSQTQLLIDFFFFFLLCLRQIISKIEERKESLEELRTLLHIPRRGTRMESSAEL